MNYKAQHDQKDFQEMTSYRAIEICEGFGSGENADEETVLQAWAHLIRTGEVWTLQGFYGRTADFLISNGKIDQLGNIL